MRFWTKSFGQSQATIEIYSCPSQFTRMIDWLPFMATLGNLLTALETSFERV